MPSTEIEEVFSIESGSGLIDLTVINLTKDPVSNQLTANAKTTLTDTSFLIYTEGLAADGHIALAKIGPDFFHALKKDRSIIYKLSTSHYFFQPEDSVDLGSADLLLITLKSPVGQDENALRKQFEEILNFFATVVTEVPSASPEVDAVKRLCSTFVTSRIYPTLNSERNGHAKECSTISPASRIAAGIVTGAEYIALGFNYGTRFAEDLIHSGGEHLVSRETRRERKEVDPRVITILRAVRIGAETASVVAEKAVEKISEAAQMLGQFLVPHIELHGTNLVAHLTGKSKEASHQHVKDALTVTASGIQGFGTIYSSITASAKQLARAVGDETCSYVQKRYGNDAAEATQEAMYAAGHTASAVVTTTQLGPKAVAKRVVKTAAAETVRGAGS